MGEISNQVMTMATDGLSLGQLVDQLRNLGIAPRENLMVHAPLRAVGPVEGGPQTVAQALLESVTPGGNLMAYVSWQDSPYEKTLGGNRLSEEDKAAWPAYGVDVAPYSGFGALNIFILRLPGALRSAHPDASMAAVGPSAHYLIQPHYLGTGYGPGSPLERFVESAGKVLMLGAPLDSVTVLHYAEAIARIPGKRFVSYQVPVEEAGAREWVDVHELDSNDILDCFAYPNPMDAVETISRDYAALGRHARGKVGRADCHLFDAQDIVAFGVSYLEHRFGRA
jgi:aminoglycoside N3'-acetyltransferase